MVFLNTVAGHLPPIQINTSGQGMAQQLHVELLECKGAEGAYAFAAPFTLIITPVPSSFTIHSLPPPLSVRPHSISHQGRASLLSNLAPRYFSNIPLLFSNLYQVGLYVTSTSLSGQSG